MEPGPSCAVSTIDVSSTAPTAGHFETDIPVPSVGRPVRQRQLPARYRDILPQSTSPIDTGANNTEPKTTQITRIRLIVRDTIQTAANVFGLWREYQHRPSYDPDSAVDVNDLADSNPENADLHPSLAKHDPDSEPVHRNPTIESLINWQNTGSTSKSNNEVNRLVKEVLRQPGFSVEDLKGFDATQENQ